MVRFCYNLLLTLLAPVAIPVWIVRSLAKGHSWGSLLEALGKVPLPKDTTAQPPIWFHAVSVGEVQASLPLLRQIRLKLPGAPIFVSTGTPTGRRLADSTLSGIAEATFRAPLELRWCVARVFHGLRPQLLVVAETELWPNYFFEARSRGVPVIVANGRMSDRSAPKYRALRFFFRHVLACADFVLAQSEVDRQRFVGAGSISESTLASGNLKYDFNPSEPGQEVREDLRTWLDDAAPDLLMIAGSTREGEESMLAPALRSLAERESGLLAIVAPRHPARSDEAARALAASGLPIVRRTSLKTSAAPKLPMVLLLDSLGELAAVYRNADLVFVGGSLNGWGGHNVLEPVLFGRPVIVGPAMQNFRGITNDLLQVGGLVQVPDAPALARKLVELAADAPQRESIGRKGKERAESLRGASERTADHVATCYAAALTRQPPGALATLGLGPISVLWSLVAKLRRSAHGKGLLTSRQLSLPVISVGNLTAGGTGKTPAVAWIVESLAEQGLTSAVLTRGYRRKAPDRVTLHPASSSADPLLMGDEPAMLARHFVTAAPNTVFAIGPDRYRAGKEVERQKSIRFLVLDDGFQHLRLRRSLNIVLVDCSNPFGNGFCLPLGRLREPIESLRHADVALLTRARPGSAHTKLCERLREINPGIQIFRSRMSICRLVDVSTGDAADLGSLRGKRVGVFCGIGNPASFHRQVSDTGAEIVFTRDFRDHYRYAQTDLDSLTKAATTFNAGALVTTAKDAVNLSGLALPMRLYVLEIELTADDPERLLELVLAQRERTVQ